MTQNHDFFRNKILSSHPHRIAKKLLFSMFAYQQTAMSMYSHTKFSKFRIFGSTPQWNHSFTLNEYTKTKINSINKLYNANEALIALAKNNIIVVPIGTEIVIIVLKILYIDVCFSSGTDCKINASSFGFDIPAK